MREAFIWKLKFLIDSEIASKSPWKVFVQTPRVRGGLWWTLYSLPPGGRGLGEGGLDGYLGKEAGFFNGTHGYLDFVSPRYTSSPQDRPRCSA